MEIFIGILIGIIVLIFVILLLPVRISFKNDEENNLLFKIKFLFFSFPDKKSSGKHIKKEVKEEKPKEKKGILDSVKENKGLIIALLNELSSLFKKFTLKKFHLDILCSGSDAAQTAIKYGACCSLVYPLTSFIDSLMKPKYKNQQINIRSNFETKEEFIKYEIEISVKVISLVLTLIKVAIRKAKAS